MNILICKKIYLSASRESCELGPPWLLWLCVVFGVLFLSMLCVNMFLCSAMTCSFSKDDRTELGDEEELKTPSVYTVQDYDPYRSWAGSQYGSRFSLDHPGTRPLTTASPGRPLGAANGSVKHLLITSFLLKQDLTTQEQECWALLVFSILVCQTQSLHQIPDQVCKEVKGTSIFVVQVRGMESIMEGL